MRLVLLLGLGSAGLLGQVCAPAPIVPAGQTAGSLGGSSCRLPDGTPYDSYRLVLPVRGQMQTGFDGALSTFGLILRDASGAQIASGTSIQRQVEAGTYTLLVNGQTAGAAGPYNLQTSFTAEPGMWCSNFASLGLNQNVNGTLGATGCKRPDGTPYEAYSVSTFGGGILTVSVSSAAFTPWLMVRGDDGSLLASDAASVQLPVTSFSTYQVVVSTADNAGAYQVSTSFQANAGETCVAQKSFTDSTAHNGSITADSCATVIDGGDAAYFNYYNITVSAAGLLDVAVSSTDFTPTLDLLDAAGNTLAIDANGGGRDAAAGMQSEIRFPVKPGSYVMQVFSNFASGGNYKLNYTFTAGAPQPCVPASYAIAAAQPGTISAASCRTTVGPGDLYEVTLAAPGTLTADLAASAFASVLAIRDKKDNLVAMNQDVEGLGVSHLAATLPAGTYTIVAAANSGAGFYQMTSRFSAGTIGPCTDGQPLALNTGYIRALGIGGCVGANGQAVDLYRFTMPSAGTIAAVMTSSQVDGYVTLTDQNGKVLRTDQNSYAVNDPFLAQYLPAGDYQLWARSAATLTGGLYQMTLLAAPGDRPAFCGPTGPLAPGGSVNGTLTFTSCQYADQSFADIYRVDLTSDTTVDLRMTSGDFDAYLIVLDTTGNVLAQDDDGGGGTDARVVQALPAGTYYVVAKQFANYYPGGKYSVSLASYAGQ